MVIALLLLFCLPLAAQEISVSPIAFSPESAVAKWLPSDIDSLKLWCESRFYDYTDGAAVANWRDTSGQALHWVLTKVRWYDDVFGSVGAYRLWDDSNSYGRQDSIVKYLRGSDQPFTIFQVVKVRDFDAYATGQREAYWCAYSASETPRMWIVNLTGTTEMLIESRRRDDASSEVTLDDELATDTTALLNGAILCSRFEGDSLKVWIGTTLHLSNAVDVGVATFDQFFLGARYLDEYNGNFDFGAFLFYNRELTNDECTLVRNYLTTKYGL